MRAKLPRPTNHLRIGELAVQIALALHVVAPTALRLKILVHIPHKPRIRRPPLYHPFCTLDAAPPLRARHHGLQPIPIRLDPIAKPPESQHPPFDPIAHPRRRNRRQRIRKRRMTIPLRAFAQKHDLDALPLRLILAIQHAIDPPHRRPYVPRAIPKPIPLQARPHGLVVTALVDGRLHRRRRRPRRRYRARILVAHKRRAHAGIAAADHDPRRLVRRQRSIDPPIPQTEPARECIHVRETLLRGQKGKVLRGRVDVHGRRRGVSVESVLPYDADAVVLFDELPEETCGVLQAVERVGAGVGFADVVEEYRGPGLVGTRRHPVAVEEVAVVGGGLVFGGGKGVDGELDVFGFDLLWWGLCGGGMETGCAGFYGELFRLVERGDVGGWGIDTRAVGIQSHICKERKGACEGVVHCGRGM